MKENFKCVWKTFKNLKYTVRPRFWQLVGAAKTCCQKPTIRGIFLRTQELILWVNCLSNMIFSFSYLISSSFIFIYSWNTKKFKIFIIFKRKFFSLNIDLPKSKHWLCYACFENILLKTGFCLNRGNKNNNNNNLFI